MTFTAKHLAAWPVRRDAQPILPAPAKWLVASDPMSSPTHRTLAALKQQGYTCAIVERWNSFARCRQDLWGIVDVLAMCDGEPLLGVQATSGSNHSARRVKSLAEPRLRTWLACGCAYEIWSWSQRGARGKRKLWACRKERLTLADLDGLVQAA